MLHRKCIHLVFFLYHKQKTILHLHRLWAAENMIQVRAAEIWLLTFNPSWTVCPLLVCYSDTDVTLLCDEAKEQRSPHVTCRVEIVKSGSVKLMLNYRWSLLSSSTVNDSVLFHFPFLNLNQCLFQLLEPIYWILQQGINLKFFYHQKWMHLRD